MPLSAMLTLMGIMNYVAGNSHENLTLVASMFGFIIIALARGMSLTLEEGIAEWVCAASPFGSTVMEALLWELLAPGVVTRVILAGTAGALGGYSGPHMAPVQVTEATSVYQSFDAPPAPYVPSWHLDLPEVASISTDRFYGFSPMTDDAFPAEPGLCEAWSKWGNADAIVEMEVAAFFHFAQRLAPALQYAAVKVVANDVSALESLPDGSARAMQRAVDAAWAAF